MNEKEKLQQKAGEIADKYVLRTAVLFGSRARGDHNAHSDYDIGIVTENPLSPLEVAGISSVFSQHIGAEVEVSQIMQMSPLYQKNVVEEGILLYECEEGYFDRLAVYIYNLYRESLPFLRMRHEQLFGVK